MAIGDPLVLTLVATIPESTTTSYTLEVKAPFTSVAIFQLCNLKIKSVGENMPCVNLDDKTAVYTTRETGSTYSDTATLDLGGVTNLHIEQTNASADLITFEIVVKPLDSAVDTTSYNVDVTLTYGNSQTVTAQASVLVTGSSSLTVLSVSISLNSQNIPSRCSSRIDILNLSTGFGTRRCKTFLRIYTWCIPR